MFYILFMFAMIRVFTIFQIYNNNIKSSSFCIFCQR